LKKQNSKREVVMNKLVIMGVTIYMVAMLAVGYYSSRKIKIFSDFMVAGRRLGFWLATATLVATWFGAGSCMGASGTVYSGGVIGVVSDPFAAGLALILAGIFYVGYLRRMNLLTVTDIFGIYYSKKSEIFASILMVPVYIGWLGSQMVAIGYILNVLTGMDTTLGIILGSGVVIIYTYQGGMWAVTLTDFLQIIFIFIGLIAMMPPVLDAVGGFGSLLSENLANDPKVLDFYPKEGGYNDWVPYMGQWLLMGLGCIVGQDLIQRSLSSRNEKIARRSAITSGVVYIIMGLMPITIGLAGRMLMPGLEDSEMLMPSMAMKYLNPFMMILFVGALISAIMSSADSSLLAAVSLSTENILFRIYTVKEEDKLKYAKYTTLIMAVLSLLVALMVKEIYDLMVNSWATLWVGIFAPVTFALYWKKANNLAAWVSMISGTGVWLGYILIVGLPMEEISDDIFYAAATYGGFVSIISYVLVTLFRYKYINPVHLASEDPEVV
jgi:solute:Na+ symporter, SSS family